MSLAQHMELRGVRNARVLEAMHNTPRHLFVPADDVCLAYADRPLPIGYGATISQPYIVALMTELLDVHTDHKVLEIGTGSGYQTAILSLLSAHVCSMEMVPQLAQEAAARLLDLGYQNVTIRHGDGYLGWPARVLFDRILLTAAPLAIPPALLDQLTPGGRLVAPVGGRDQHLYLFDKLADGSMIRTVNIAVRFIPMVTGLDEAR